ncbi:DUF397 domain-containing protein [Streptomyces sp. NPDC021012]|uniref:DUF397 domain-containing protein n=1 Tax=Streptomyces sp. NPDC021012 TaxID=3365107 RepID=UPI00378AEAE7
MSSAALSWFKSSYSGSEGGNCLEVAYDWRKSSYSGDEGGNCVEVAAHPAAVHVRDSKLGESSPVFSVSPAVWGSFVGGAAS